jgi:hypothetical protein
VGGLYDCELAVGSQSGRLEVTLRRSAGRSSHAVTWAQVSRLVEQAVATSLPGTPGEQAFAAYRALVTHPRYLSDVRNEINYDVGRNPFVAGMWPTEIFTLPDADAVYDRVLRFAEPSEERRSEVVLVGAASLLRQLRDVRSELGARVDRRRADQRRAAFSDCPEMAWLA